MNTLNRRKFLKFFTLTSVVVLLTSVAVFISKIFFFPFSRRKKFVKIDVKSLEIGINEFYKEKIAIIKSEKKIYILSTVCTHLGCIVKWNEANSFFECPCHRSIFSKKGIVLRGPAKKPLKKLGYKIKNNKVTVWL